MDLGRRVHINAKCILKSCQNDPNRRIISTAVVVLLGCLIYFIIEHVRYLQKYFINKQPIIKVKWAEYVKRLIAAGLIFSQMEMARIYPLIINCGNDRVGEFIKFLSYIVHIPMIMMIRNFEVAIIFRELQVEYDPDDEKRVS